jgi:anti-sigma-K factor RskA
MISTDTLDTAARRAEPDSQTPESRNPDPRSPDPRSAPPRAGGKAKPRPDGAATEPEPGDDLLARVEATVAAIAEKLSPVPQLERSLRRWRLSFFLLGAVSAGVIAFGLHLALPVGGAGAVAALTPDAAPPPFLVALEASERDLLVRRLADAPPSGQVHHLWIVAGSTAPRHLGRLDADGTTILPRPPTLVAGARFVVSLEDADATPAAPSASLATGSLTALGR